MEANITDLHFSNQPQANLQAFSMRSDDKHEHKKNQVNYCLIKVKMNVNSLLTVKWMHRAAQAKVVCKH